MSCLRPHPRPVIKCDGRSLAFALSLARRFDVSRCSNCFGWLSSLQPPQSRIVLLVNYLSVISNDLIASLKLRILSFARTAANLLHSYLSIPTSGGDSIVLFNPPVVAQINVWAAFPSPNKQDLP